LNSLLLLPERKENPDYPDWADLDSVNELLDEPNFSSHSKGIYPNPVLL